MEWVLRLNHAINYMEENMTEEIDVTKAAQIAGCSLYHFQRMFSYVTCVSIAEYIRRRRLTFAAFELQNSTVKVIDLAIKYGYDSPEAFSRAFQNLHGVTPTAARQAGVKLKAYTRMSFHMSIKGDAEMNYKIVELSAFSIIGFSERVANHNAFNTVPQVWKKAKENGMFERLWEIRKPSKELGDILGVIANGDHGQNEHFDYILAVPSDEEPTVGMVKVDLPGSLWAVFEAPGSPDDLQDIWKRLYTEWVPSSAYDLAYLPAVECYLPIEENRNELWIPIVKKALLRNEV